jgi:type III restriction enzyme
LTKRGIKVLSLFFIDRVANYRDYDEQGHSVPGKFAVAFEAELAELADDPRYESLTWLKEPAERLHNGYFAQDKKGLYKDTRGDTQADDDAYSLIMREKQRLLSLDEPLRFIFSHSALREGWDSPNVFQICTLNETKSTMKKRQEIGRGLRLPVDQTGNRVFDDSVNRLYVMANESYEDFARALQTEYEEDCGVTFGKVPLTAFAKITTVVDGDEQPIGSQAAGEIRTALIVAGLLDEDGRIQPAFDPRRSDFKLELPEPYVPLAAAITDLLSQYQIERHIRRERDDGPNKLRKEVTLRPEFKELWDQIKPKTTYRVEFDTEKLVEASVAAVKKMQAIEKPEIVVTTASVGVKKGGVEAALVGVSREDVEASNQAIPDVLAYLQNETELTRSTIVRILKESGRLGEIFNNPQRFLDAVARIINYELHRLLVDGIKYERLADGPGSEWEMMRFENEELINYLAAEAVDKSIYEYVVYDSEIERQFAKQLDTIEDIKLFMKLPGWFEIDTPLGKYNPDWAILKQNGETLYLVRETKSTKDFLKLRTTEADKVRCGKAHFTALEVDFAVAVTAAEV